MPLISRKIVTMHGGFHPKSSPLRLYTKRKERGCGLLSIRATIWNETTEIQEYIRKMAPSDKLLSECLGQLKPGGGNKDEEALSWKDKHLHGMYH